MGSIGNLSARRAPLLAQLLYIRNSQQIREAQANGEIDLYLRLDSVQQFGLTGYAHILDIVANARLEASRATQAFVADTLHRDRRPRRPSKHLHAHESQAVVALADSFLALASDTEDAQAAAQPRHHESTDSQGPLSW